MSAHAPRSIDEYLKQLRSALEGEDAALIQDALYDSEEYLRAELAAHPQKSEADVLELIASTYGAPDEVAAAYRATDAQVSKALKTPPRASAAPQGAWARFFGVFLDPRAYLSLSFMLLSLATGILYFTFAVTGLSLSVGFAVLIIGIPFFLAFIGMARVIALGEGRLLEAATGERMPRRPVHPGPPATWWARIAEMLTDARTWTTLCYLLLMLPLGTIYFVLAIFGLSLGLACLLSPLAVVADHFGWFPAGFVLLNGVGSDFVADHPLIGELIFCAAGVMILTLLMHAARGVVRMHTRLAKALLVEPGA
jgi:uncharacterized membrane protein